MLTPVEKDMTDYFSPEWALEKEETEQVSEI